MPPPTDWRRKAQDLQRRIKELETEKTTLLTENVTLVRDLQAMQDANDFLRSYLKAAGYGVVQFGDNIRIQADDDPPTSPDSAGWWSRLVAKLRQP